MEQIIIENFNKKMKNKTILSNINYTFEKGKIYGLYGRNGSGKTMLLRAISGLILPSQGKVIIGDQELNKDIDFPNSIGVVIEHTDLFPQYDGITNLEILAKIKNVATTDDIKEAIELVGLDPLDRQKVRQYSLGMKQKLSIAQAIFEKPEILLLDEPTNALDSRSIDLIRKILLQRKEAGVIVVIASHNKDDINLLCDSILIMENGEIIEEVKEV